MSETNRGIAISSFTELQQFARTVVASSLKPVHIKSEADAILVLQFGAELGVSPMQALQGLHVVKGKVGADGDMLLGLIRRSNHCQWIAVSTEGSGDNLKAIVRSQRVGAPEESRSEFTWVEAKAAGLTGSDTYKKYPKRMLTWRAVGYHSKDFYSDVAKGLDTIEELESIPDRTAMKMPASQVQTEDTKTSRVAIATVDAFLSAVPPVWKITDTAGGIYATYSIETAEEIGDFAGTGEFVELVFSAKGKSHPVILRFSVDTGTVADAEFEDADGPAFDVAERAQEEADAPGDLGFSDPNQISGIPTFAEEISREGKTTFYKIGWPSGEETTTFSASIYETALRSRDEGEPIAVSIIKNGKFLNIDHLITQ